MLYASSVGATSISELTNEATSLAINDLTVISYYTPSGYISKKITVNNFFSGGGTLTTGDMFYWNGTKLVNLTPTTVGQVLRLGTLPTWSTSTFADTYAKGSFLYNATANTVDALAHPGAANYLLATNSADSAGWFASSANIITFLGSADNATARTNLGAQSLHANLTAIAGVTPTANCVYAYDSGVVLGCFETHLHDNSAAQFIDATTATKKVKIDPVGVTATKTATIAFQNTNDATYTFPAVTASLAPLASPTFTSPVLGVATGTSLVATGIIDGKVNVTITTAATTINSATQSQGYFINNGDSAAKGIYTLPTAAAGLQYCIALYSEHATGATAVMKFQTSAAGQYIALDGVRTASGGLIKSTGAAGDAACVVGISATEWVAYHSSGTWSKD